MVCIDAIGFLAAPPLFVRGRCNARFAHKDETCGTRTGLSPCASLDVRSLKPAHDVETFSKLLYQSQKEICVQLEEIDNSEKFSVEPWRSGTGEGVARVLQNGSIFEKAGVNVSVVHGKLSKARADALASRDQFVSPGSTYRAAALSFVLHAQSPFLPTLRGDVRMFATGDKLWGGGGVDLTVSYLDRPRIANFHRFWKRICDMYSPHLYPQLKRQCDEYFYLPSRGEYRGVGGLFYDDLPLSAEQLFSFQRELLQNFIPSYLPLVESQRHKRWTPEQKRWQRIRRGRYLEFNLLHDRGVRFGIAGLQVEAGHILDPVCRKTLSRIENIMISAPPSVEWSHRFVPDAGSLEEETVLLLQQIPLDWAKQQPV